MEDYYSILDVAENAELSEIKLKYQSLVKKYHPDKQTQSFLTKACVKNIGEDNSNSRCFHLIQNAWKTLSDETLRRQYDSNLKQQRFEKQIHVFDEIKLSEMEVRMSVENDKIYFHYCRCGGEFMFDDISKLSVVLQCENCSSYIRVIL